MGTLIGDTLEGESIKSSLTSRGKTYIEKTIRYSTKEALDKRLKIDESEGWELLRPNKKSYRLKKEKELDEQLEDELWCLASKMGFTEMSDGRQFKISVGDSLEPRQIDVFAKDDESVLFIECTQCATPTKKDMSALIQKIGSINGDIRKSVIAHYGKAEPLKMRWVIATRNIEWGQADLNKAKEAQIIVLQDKDIDYFKKLTSHIKNAARYQFLAHVFSGEAIKGLQHKVLATRGTMGGRKFYNFLIHPNDLLKLAYISHKASSHVDDIETYQRMLKPSRLKNIADYIDNGGQFPTNIVVNIKSKNKRKMKFEKTDDVGGVAVGLLTLPQQYCCAWVIDGQHRLYGYAYSDRSEKSNDKTAFPVLAYENMPPKEEAKMFVDINHEQVKVQKSLLIEIYSTLNWGSDDPVELIEAISSRVGLIIDRTPSSPFYNRIITSGNQKSGLRCLTTTSFSDGLRENKFFGEQTKSGGFIEGPFWASYASEDALDRTLEKAQEILNGYFGFFATNAGEHWNLGDGQGGFLAMNLGVRTLLRVLKSLLAFTERETGLNCRDLRADEILDYIEQYTAPISNFFKDSTAEKVAPFRRNSSLAGVKDNSLGMMFFIKEEFADFYADGLKEYIDSRDEEGTEESRKLVADIQKMMSTFVIGKLKEHYGEKDRHWWYEGIPNSIRERCVKDRENAHGKGEPENYFYLLDYSAIAANNWASIFQHSFSYYNQGKKIDRLKWVKELNDIRNIVSHPERGVLNTEQVQFVRNLHQYTKEKFKLQS